jgi:serine protease Do
MTVAAELGSSIAEVAGRVGPAVVGLGRGAGPGSGVVVAEGRILTAIGRDGPDELNLIFADGHRETGRRIATEPDLGLTLVAADTRDAPAVQAAPEGSLPLGLGTPVFALADPGARGLRATLGFVASAGRSFRGPRGRRVEGAIEHTAALPRGSSGGPLVDGDGRLVGINLLRREGGLILAVPAGGSQLARLEKIVRGEAVPAPRLGVALASPRAAQRMRRAVGLPERAGLLVRGVEAESPAERAGLARGDLLVAAGERELSSVGALLEELDDLGGGGTLALTVVRGTDELQVEVAFAAAEARGRARHELP